MKHNLISIDYTEYPFPPNDHANYVYYKCLNCSAYFENNKYANVDNYYGYRNYTGDEKLTCEEVIIKSVIE